MTVGANISNLAKNYREPRIGLGIALLAMAAFGPPHHSSAVQPQDLPTADQVIRDYIEAIGSEMALQTIVSTESTAEIDMLNGTRGSFRFYAIGNEKWRYELERGSLLVFSFNADRAWRGTGDSAQEMSKIKWRQFHEMVPMETKSLLWLNYDGAISMQGVEAVRGHPCYKLRFKPPIGTEVFRYFDRETKLLRRISYKSGSSIGDWYLSDWREVSGIKVPFVRKQYFSDQHRYTVTKRTVKFNVKVDNSLFVCPIEDKESETIKILALAW